jgi:hypothetical protein
MPLPGQRIEMEVKARALVEPALTISVVLEITWTGEVRTLLRYEGFSVRLFELLFQLTQAP